MKRMTLKCHTFKKKLHGHFTTSMRQSGAKETAKTCAGVAHVIIIDKL